MNRVKVKKITLEDLAAMTKNGFDEMGERIGGVGERIGGVGERIGGVEERIGGVEEELKKFRKENSREHEEIKLRLDNVAYRFELMEVVKRVERLEKIAGVLKRS